MIQTDGEKEIVLGNKQLISVFFLVVILCGVFFAVGYMIGRSGAKPEVAVAAPASEESTGGAVRNPAPQPAEPPRETASDSASSADSAPVPAPKSAFATKPAQDVPPAAEAGISVPQPGATYLQVTALRRTDADSLAKTLREQNFPTLVAESSKPDLFRVLVGPYHQTADVADAKAKLKALGFGDAFIQK